MKNMTNRALCALMTLAIIAPAYGMSRLTQGFAGYHAKKAVYNTLGARLFNRSAFNQGFKTTQLPVKAAATQAKPGFFSKWFAAIPLIGWMWQSNEEQWAKELLKQSVIKDTLVSPSWNPHHPEIAKYVLGKCTNMHKMGPKPCGDSVKTVQALIEQERLKRLEKLDKEFDKSISYIATQYTKGAITLGCKTKDGEISLTQASDEQLQNTLAQVEDKYFPRCKAKDMHDMCKAARETSFKQLQLFRNATQETTSSATKSATQK